MTSEWRRVALLGGVGVLLLGVIAWETRGKPAAKAVKYPPSLARSETLPLAPGMFLNREGTAVGTLPALEFTAPTGPWTVSWATNCPVGFDQYSTPQIEALNTQGEAQSSWYSSGQAWSQTVADGQGSARSGLFTLNQPGPAFLEINALCHWHVVVERGSVSTSVSAPEPPTGFREVQDGPEMEPVPST